MMGSALALPTGASHFNRIKDLAPSLGKITPIGFQGASGGCPKHIGPPENETAASMAIENGGNEKRNGGDRSEVDCYHVPRIIAKHFGVDGGTP